MNKIIISNSFLKKYFLLFFGTKEKQENSLKPTCCYFIMPNCRINYPQIEINCLSHHIHGVVDSSFVINLSDSILVDLIFFDLFSSLKYTRIRH